MSDALQNNEIARLRVLVVDDNAAMRGLLRATLQAFGCERIVEAEHGESALAILCSEPVDLVITDWKMRPMDGAALLRAIRDRSRSPKPYVPVIVLSAYADAGKMAEARDYGANEFVVKPFTPENLVRTIRAVLADPSAFVSGGGYFGPDRRRKGEPDFAGPDRRMRERAAS